MLDSRKLFLALVVVAFAAIPAFAGLRLVTESPPLEQMLVMDTDLNVYVLLISDKHIVGVLPSNCVCVYHDHNNELPEALTPGNDELLAANTNTTFTGNIPLTDVAVDHNLLTTETLFRITNGVRGVELINGGNNFVWSLSNGGDTTAVAGNQGYAIARRDFHHGSSVPVALTQPLGG